MNKIDQKFIERIEQLLEKGKKVKATIVKKNTDGFFIPPQADMDIFNEWKVNVENLIIKINGKDGVYYNRFVNALSSGYESNIDSGLGVLRGLKEDIENGFMVSIKEFVKAEVFADFLEMADHLLEYGYKDPAASLIGAVLENGLKDIATKNSVAFSKRDRIDDINKKLVANNVYNNLIRDQVTAWKAIRNSADHGKFEEYDIDHVKHMNTTVKKFLTDYL